MSAQGDYLRSLLNTVTTFNMMLETVADAFDGATVDDASAANGDGDEDDETGEPAARSRSPAVSFSRASFKPKKKPGVIKRKTRRRY